MVTHQSGISNKHHKVHNNPNLSSRVSGICIGHRDYDNLSPSAQTALYPEGGISPLFIGESLNKGPSFLHWNVGSNQTRSVDRSPSLSCPAGHEDSVTSLASFLPELSEPVRGGTSRSFGGSSQTCLPTVQPKC